MLNARSGEPPLTWKCFGNTNVPYVSRICASPTEGWAFYYDITGSPWVKAGVLRTEPPETPPVLYGWNVTSPSGYVVYSSDVNQVNFGAILYGVEFNATPQALADAKVDHLWAMYGDNDDLAWLTYKLEANGSTYYFDPMRPHPAIPSAYVPIGVQIDGADFQLNITHVSYRLSYGGVPIGAAAVESAGARHIAR